MIKKDKKEVSLDLTQKGLAMIAAIESGLLPKVKGGWDDAYFKIFWNTFEKLLNEGSYSILKISKD